jgi:hypothetical protein
MASVLFSQQADAQTATGPNLQSMDCSQEGMLRSLFGNDRISVHFSNLTAQPLDVYWLNYNGERVRYRILAPGEDYTQQTYVTHPWVLAYDDGGQCVALYLPR